MGRPQQCYAVLLIWFVAVAALFCAFNPITPTNPRWTHGRGSGLEVILRFPNPYVRWPFDGLLAIAFAYLGFMVSKNITAGFVLDRWKPPTE
jgi:hypothetical protein